jgi:hypothetical protein
MADGDSGSRPAEHFVGLEDAIAALRRQVSEAASVAARPRFEIAEIEMEFSVEAVTGTDGRVTFWVVSAGTDGKPGHPASHRVMIKLTLREPERDEGRNGRITRGWDEGDRLG